MNQQNQQKKQPQNPNNANKQLPNPGYGSDEDSINQRVADAEQNKGDEKIKFKDQDDADRKNIKPSQNKDNR